MVHPEGFEPTTFCSEDRRSNPLSYGCKEKCETALVLASHFDEHAVESEATLRVLMVKL